MPGSKIKVSTEDWLATCNAILESSLPDAEKISKLNNYALNNEIATETEIFNGLLHSKESK